MKTDSNPMTVRADWDNLYENDGEVPDITLKQPYEMVFWGQLLPRLLRKAPSHGKLIELGSAPGRYAMILSRITGYELFGVEFTARGAKSTARHLQNTAYHQTMFITIVFSIWNLLSATKIVMIW